MAWYNTEIFKYSKITENTSYATQTAVTIDEEIQCRYSEGMLLYSAVSSIQFILNIYIWSISRFDLFAVTNYTALIELIIHANVIFYFRMLLASSYPS